MEQAEHPLFQFLGKHKGETAWIFGKGPSLDLFDLNKAGPLRCCINDTISRVPERAYCFANDRVNDWADLYREDDTLFQPKRTLTDRFLQANRPPCNVVIFNDDYIDDALRRPRVHLAECLAIRRGTLGSCIQILHIMGVAKVIAVGIDGGNSHATGQWRTRIRSNHYEDYNAIRNQFIDSCELLGIELEFITGDYRQERNGRMRVEILRDVFVRDAVYRIGDRPMLLPADAKDLVAGRAARFYRGEDPKPEPQEPAPEPAKKAAKKRAKK